MNGIDITQLLIDIIKLGGFCIALTFINKILKSVGRDNEATAVSLIGLAGILIITIGYVVKMFEAVQTMVVF